MTTRKLAMTAALACAAVAPAAAIAQAADDWRFHAILYGYLPTISGTTVFPQAGSSVTVSPDKIIGSLKGAFMGTIEMEKGRWGAFTDLMYLNVNGSTSQSRDIAFGGSQIPVGATADLDLKVKAWVWTLAGTYQVSADPVAPVQVLVGARLVDIEQKLDWQTSGNVGSIPPPGRQGSLRTR